MYKIVPSLVQLLFNFYNCCLCRTWWQAPSCIKQGNFEEFVQGTLNGVVVDIDFILGFLFFDVSSIPVTDTFEVCLLYDADFDLDAVSLTYDARVMSDDDEDIFHLCGPVTCSVPIA